MSVPLILLAGLLIGAMAAGADASASALARRRLIDRRMELLALGLGPLPPPAAAPTALPKGPRVRVRALLELALGLGVVRQWGIKVSRLTLSLSAVLAGAIAWMLLRDLIRAPAPFSLILALMAAVATPRVLVRVEQNSLKARFLDALPDAIDMIVRTLRAGVPITTAVRTVATDAAPPVNGVFASLADQTEIGVPLDEALAEAARWISLPDYRFFAVAVALQYATGGNLVATLESLSAMVRRRRVMRLKAKAVSAEVRSSAYILSALPFLVVAALVVTAPDYLKPLVSDRRGTWILGIAVGNLLAGLFVMRRMMHSVSSD